MQRYVVGHPIIFRRGETKVKNVGLQSFLGDAGVTRMFYGTGEDDFYSVTGSFRNSNEFGFAIGGQSMELQPGSVEISPFLPQYDRLPSLRLISDVMSWQYAMLTLPSDIHISTFCDRIGSYGKFVTEWLYHSKYRDYNGNKMSQYLDYHYSNMSTYPYVYEWKIVDSEISEQKLTTWSKSNPTSVMHNKRTGDETVKMSSLGLINISSSWSDKVKTAWTNYTRKLDGNYVYGLMAIARGVTTTNITTRNFIRFFLQRCTNIDTTNDWTHIQLT